MAAGVSSGTPEQSGATLVEVFISYGRESAAEAREVADDAQALGHNVWYDADLTGGQQWWDQILKEIRRCRVMVFLISRASLDSEACRRERQYAGQLAKAVIPVLIGTDISDSVLPADLRGTQSVDYRTSDKASLKALARALSALPPAAPLPNPLPGAPNVPISHLALLRDRIAGLTLLPDDQRSLLLELQTRLDITEEAESIRELLSSLRKRPDLIVSVANHVDALLRTTEGRAAERGGVRNLSLLWSLLYGVGVYLVGLLVHELTGDRSFAIAVAMVLIVGGVLYHLRWRRRTT